MCIVTVCSHCDLFCCLLYCVRYVCNVCVYVTFGTVVILLCITSMYVCIVFYECCHAGAGHHHSHPY